MVKKKKQQKTADSILLCHYLVPSHNPSLAPQKSWGGSGRVEGQGSDGVFPKGHCRYR